MHERRSPSNAASGCSLEHCWQKRSARPLASVTLCALACASAVWGREGQRKLKGARVVKGWLCGCGLQGQAGGSAAVGQKQGGQLQGAAEPPAGGTAHRRCAGAGRRGASLSGHRRSPPPAGTRAARGAVRRLCSAPALAPPPACGWAAAAGARFRSAPGAWTDGVCACLGAGRRGRTRLAAHGGLSLRLGRLPGGGKLASVPVVVLDHPVQHGVA